MISFDSIERIGDALLKEKKLPGQFIIGRHYDQGPIPLAKTYIVELFWNYHGQNLLVLHEEQPKTLLCMIQYMKNCSSISSLKEMRYGT